MELMFDDFVVVRMNKTSNLVLMASSFMELTHFVFSYVF